MARRSPPTTSSRPTTIIAARTRNRRSSRSSRSSSDIKADGEDTVVFTLKSGSADFPYITSDYHLPIYPAKDGGGIDWEKGISAGPYIIENFEPGVKCTAKRNPNYFKTEQPYFDAVEILVDRRCRRRAPMR